MKRLAAIVAAVAMVGVAFVLRDVFGDATDDDDVATADTADGGGAELVCPSEFADTCAIASADVVTAAAGDTADVLLAATRTSDLGADAWVVPRAWADLVVAERERLGLAPLFEIADPPVASSPTIIAIWSDRAAELGTVCTTVEWSCVAQRVGTTLADGNRVQAGLPSVESATGLTIAAAQAAALLGLSDFAVNDFTGDFETLVDRLAAGQRDQPLRAMRREGPGRFTAVGVVAADAEPLTSSFGSIVTVTDTTPTVRADLVALVPAGEGLDDGRRRALTAAFGAAGWGAPVDGPDGLPAGGVLAAIRTRWNDSR